MTFRPSVILAPQTVTAEIGLEPVINFLNNAAGIAFHDMNYGVDEWVGQTALSLPPEVLHRSRVIFGGLPGLIPIICRVRFDSIPEYLDWLASLDPVQLRDESIEHFRTEAANMAKEAGLRLEIPPADQLLADVNASLNLMEELYKAKKIQDTHVEFPELVIEGHMLLNDPSVLQHQLVDLLRYLWDHVLAADWEHHLPILQESVDAFRQVDLRGMTGFEAIRAVTGRDMRGIMVDELDNIDHLIFVPGAHLGPYLAHYVDGRKMWIVFPARVPEGVKPRSPEITRSELFVRVSALADDTRLRILELLTKHDELCAQDIITMLDLSQSAASRHLRQLSATGYLTERRLDGNKCYRLNPERIEGTLSALSNFLLKR